MPGSGLRAGRPVTGRAGLDPPERTPTLDLRDVSLEVPNENLEVRRFDTSCDDSRTMTAREMASNLKSGSDADRLSYVGRVEDAFASCRGGRREGGRVIGRRFGRRGRGR